MNILVPLDASPESETILPLAAQLARRWQAQILILRVMDPGLGAGDPLVTTLSQSTYDKMMAAGDSYLADLRSRHPDLSLETHCVVGTPSFCIQREASRRHCELILMATHGYHGLLRWLRGSVAEEAARNAVCPVMLVHANNSPAAFRNVLVPTDGSAHTLLVLASIRQFCEEPGRVTLLHCQGESSQVHSGLLAYLQQHPELTLECHPGEPVQGILDWMAHNPCDLVIMATHGREGIEHLWHGSLTEQVARGATCPLLVYSPASLQYSSTPTLPH